MWKCVHYTILKRLLKEPECVETNHSGVFCCIATIYEQTDEWWQH